MITVEFIYDLDCPNVAETRTHLLKAFSQSGLTANWKEWDRSSNESPPHVKLYGSPTILINGKDVAGQAPSSDSTCCRLYQDPSGAMQGVPSIETIISSLKENNIKDGRSWSWKTFAATLPGILFALLPKIACPACWPAYAGLLSSMGLGFLIETKYLLPLTAVFLVFAVGALAYKAPKRHGYKPFLLGIIAASIVLIGKFVYESDTSMYVGIGILIVASIWNSWPNKKPKSCMSC